MTNGRENLGFENDDHYIENQPVRNYAQFQPIMTLAFQTRTFQWEGETESHESTLIDDDKIPGPYKELFKTSPEWCKFFWISCLFGLPGSVESK